MNYLIIFSDEATFSNPDSDLSPYSRGAPKSKFGRREQQTGFSTLIAASGNY
jgi:hypothetical protein